MRSLDKISLFCFRRDRSNKHARSDGGMVMLLSPKNFKTKQRDDLNKYEPKYFESLWAECYIDNRSTKCQLISIAYCLKKSIYKMFLGQLIPFTDTSITVNKNCRVNGDHSINWLNAKANKFPGTILLIFNLEILDKYFATGEIEKIKQHLII